MNIPSFNSQVRSLVVEITGTDRAVIRGDGVIHTFRDDSREPIHSLRLSEFKSTHGFVEYIGRTF